MWQAMLVLNLFIKTTELSVHRGRRVVFERQSFDQTTGLPPSIGVVFVIDL